MVGTLDHLGHYLGFLSKENGSSKSCTWFFNVSGYWTVSFQILTLQAFYEPNNKKLPAVSRWGSWNVVGRIGNVVRDSFMIVIVLNCARFFINGATNQQRTRCRDGRVRARARTIETRPRAFTIAASSASLRRWVPSDGTILSGRDKSSCRAKIRAEMAGEGLRGWTVAVWPADLA